MQIRLHTRVKKPSSIFQSVRRMVEISIALFPFPIGNAPNSVSSLPSLDTMGRRYHPLALAPRVPDRRVAASRRAPVNMTVLVIFGTRPEAIKMAPVVATLHRRRRRARLIAG